MVDSTTSQFEKVGDPTSLFNDRREGTSVDPGENTISAPRDKGGPGAADDTPGTGTKANRSADLIKEANGPACYIAAKIVYPNVPEAEQEGRSVRKVTGDSGNHIWRARAEARQAAQ